MVAPNSSFSALRVGLLTTQSPFLVSSKSLGVFDSSIKNSFTSFIRSWYGYSSIRVNNALFSHFLDSPVSIDRKDLEYDSKTFYRHKEGYKNNVTVTNSIFLYCESNKGGGIFSKMAHNVLKNVVFDSCVATYGGGAYFVESYSVNLERILFLNNSADYIGAVFMDGEKSTEEPTLFAKSINLTHNCAKRWTGALREEQGSTVLTDIIFTGNEAAMCSALFDYSWQPSLLSVERALFKNNTSTESYGAYVPYRIQHRSVLNNVLFTMNTAAQGGHSIHVQASDSILILKNCAFQKSKEVEISSYWLDSNITYGSGTIFNAHNTSHDFITYLEPSKVRKL